MRSKKSGTSRLQVVVIVIAACLGMLIIRGVFFRGSSPAPSSSSAPVGLKTGVTIFAPSPTAAAALAPTAPPASTAANLVPPTETTMPPTAAPTALAMVATDSPTPEPAPQALPTAEPTAEPVEAPAVLPTPAPVYSGPADQQSVSPPYYPCALGQIKGNINSMKYHLPDGRYYDKTFKNVKCFNTAQEAEAENFVAAKSQ